MALDHPKLEKKMGLWDSIKKVATKAKCGIGFHGGTFRTPDGKPKCHLEKTCPDCMELITERKHAYEHDWKNAPFDYSSQIKCTRAQGCIHCGEIQKKEVHEEYRKLGVNARCQVVKACTRCGHEKTEGHEHSFIRDGVEDGKIVMRCTNCGTTEKRNYA